MSALIEQYLEQVNSGKGLPPMSEMLSQMAEGDPRMGLLAKVFAARESAAEDDEPIESPSLNDAADEEQRESIARLKDMAARMYAEIEELRERNDALAGALGACYLCWGEDESCPVCDGHGQPGFSSPDRALFSHYVAPPLRLLRARLKRAANRPQPRDPGLQSPNSTQPQPTEINQ